MTSDELRVIKLARKCAERAEEGYESKVWIWAAKMLLQRLERGQSTHDPRRDSQDQSQPT